jgi:hypothetical protein
MCFTKQRGTSKTQEIECIFLFFLPTAIFGIWRLVIYRWKGLENTFPTVYYMPKNVLNLHLKTQKTKICSCLVIVNQGGQNNRNGKSSNTNYQIIELYC